MGVCQGRSCDPTATKLLQRDCEMLTTVFEGQDLMAFFWSTSTRFSNSLPLFSTTEKLLSWSSPFTTHVSFTLPLRSCSLYPLTKCNIHCTLTAELTAITWACARLAFTITSLSRSRSRALWRRTGKRLVLVEKRIWINGPQCFHVTIWYPLSSLGTSDKSQVLRQVQLVALACNRKKHFAEKGLLINFIVPF